MGVTSDIAKKLTIDRALGWLTALLLAGALACWVVVLLGYSEPLAHHTSIWDRRSALITGSAIAIATLASWWLQRFVLDHDLPVRLVYAFTMLFTSFIAVGGAFIVASNQFLVPHDFDQRQLLAALRDLYWDGLDGSYSFLLFVVTALELHMLLLLALGSIFIAVFRR